MDAQEVLAMLPPHSVLAACTPAELADLLSSSSVHAMKPGDTILRQGDEGDAAVVILAGIARVSMIAPNGQEIVLDYVKRRSKGTPDRRRRGTPFSDNMMLVC